MFSYKKNQSGIVKTTIMILILVFLATILGLDLRSVVEGELFQKNVQFVKEFMTILWQKYLHPAARTMWQGFVRPYIWTPIKNFMQADLPNGETATSTSPTS